MNVKLLRRVAKHILAEPKRLRMSNWVVRKRSASVLLEDLGECEYWGEPPIQDIDFAKCGTAACIAGWTCILSGRRFTQNNAQDVAAKLLGIDDEQSRYLFVPDYWNDTFDYEAAETPEARAEIAANRIEHFIKTGE